jgi:hypothetical protein
LLLEVVSIEVGVINAGAAPPAILPLLFLLEHSSLGGVLDLRFFPFVVTSLTTTVAASLLLALNDLGVCTCVGIGAGIGQCVLVLLWSLDERRSGVGVDGRWGISGDNKIPS